MLTCGFLRLPALALSQTDVQDMLLQKLDSRQQTTVAMPTENTSESLSEKSTIPSKEINQINPETKKSKPIKISTPTFVEIVDDAQEVQSLTERFNKILIAPTAQLPNVNKYLDNAIKQLNFVDLASKVRWFVTDVRTLPVLIFAALYIDSINFGKQMQRVAEDQHKDLENLKNKTNNTTSSSSIGIDPTIDSKDLRS